MRYLVHHMLDHCANRTPDSLGVIDGDTRRSFGDIAQSARSISQSLTDLGLQRGDRVAIQMPPTYRLVESILGVSGAGGVFVPIHHGLFPAQVDHVLRDCGAQLLIADSVRFNRYASVDSELPLRAAIIDGSVDDTSIEVQQWNEAASHSETEDKLSSACTERELAAILYTSGSTGKPKGVMLSHANVLAGARIVSDYLGITSTDRLLAALPLSFDAGLNQLTTSLLQGATLSMIDFKFGRDIVQALRIEGITGLAGVPSLWSLLAQPSSGLGKAELPDLRYITNTGGAMPRHLLDTLRGMLPKTNVVLMYGLTEAFRSTYLPPEHLDDHPDSMGIAIPNTEILVINENGQSCEPGEIGELVHRGPTVSLGYWGQPEKTQQVLRPYPFADEGSVTEELVCYSGDLVKRDEAGFLYFVGRRDNQIKSSGFRISPTEVEEVLCSLESIHQAAVVGAPDKVLGQHLVAFVVPAGKSEVEVSDVHAECSARLPRHMIPKRILQRKTLPLTSNGKTDYPALRQSLQSETTAETLES